MFKLGLGVLMLGLVNMREATIRLFGRTMPYHEAKAFFNFQERDLVEQMPNYRAYDGTKIVSVTFQPLFGPTLFTLEMKDDNS